MRILSAIALATIAAGVITAYAAEERTAAARRYRAPPPPPQHYYPFTGVKPKLGRAEDLSAPTSLPQPPATYQRQY